MKEDVRFPEAQVLADKEGDGGSIPWVVGPPGGDGVWETSWAGRICRTFSRIGGEAVAVVLDYAIGIAEAAVPVKDEGRKERR